MDVIEKNLNIVFLETPPERLFSAVESRSRPFPVPERIGADCVPEKLYARYARIHLANYTDDEYRMLHQELRDAMDKVSREGECPAAATVFWLLADCGRRYLVRDNQGLRCRFESVSNWRDIYLNIGQDMVTTAFLAYEDLRSGGKTDRFAWDAVLHTDSPGLERMLQQGIAENHFHLGGSTQSFPLTWCCMMNLPGRSAPLVERALERPLYDTLAQRAKGWAAMSWSSKMELAACIRGLLYQKCRDTSFCIETRFWEQYHSLCRFSGTGNMVSRLRFTYGHKFCFPEGVRFCLDYAMEQEDSGPFRILAVERRLMYQCFSRSFGGMFSQLENDLFYLYLLLKSNFRREWIQINRRTGFQNFSDYQDRKNLVWRDIPAYDHESAYIALNGAMASGAVHSLEARLVPAPTADGVLEQIWSVDRAKLFADGEMGRGGCGRRRWIPPLSWRMGNFAENEQFFYTMHFPKRRDDSKFHRLYPRPRHDRFRKKVRRTARALAEGLSKSDYLCQRIRAIDACSNEIGCRPEVFAADFRLLRDFGMDRSRISSGIREFAPALALTYHAGEDFLDIADGLRAIDEAIAFLNFRRGDRLGHALALGVEPSDYYAWKEYKITQTRQDRLDDLVWSLFRGVELGVLPDHRLRASMEQEAHMLLQDLYAGGRRTAHSLPAYYNSWKLRGDDPELYRSGEYQAPKLSLDLYDRSQINRAAPELDTYRNTPEISRLYFLYHFDERVRQTGSQAEIFDVTIDYANFMQALQDQMQRDIAKKGIMIECNPSSNVLIGSFRAYHLHPIFRFYNRGLGMEQRRSEVCSQLCVSINTDDLGVFDTSLEFEYALLFHALLYGPDHNTEKRPFQEVKAYMDQIRQMGFDQIFPPSPRKR